MVIYWVQNRIVMLVLLVWWLVLDRTGTYLLWIDLHAERVESVEQKLGIEIKLGPQEYWPP